MLDISFLWKTTRLRHPSTAHVVKEFGIRLFGHDKDHRPDLKQLLFILTVTADGGVPLHFRAASGNVGEDR